MTTTASPAARRPFASAAPVPGASQHDGWLRRDYRHVPHSCRRCGAPAGRTPGEAQDSFDLRRAHICHARILCSTCWHDRMRLERSLVLHASQWIRSRGALRADDTFVRRWLMLLRVLPAYGGHPSGSIVRLLERLVDPA